MLDIEGTTKPKSRETERYFWVVLLGKLKGEHVDREHNVPCAHSTKTGIRVKKVDERIIDEKEKLGQFRGPMISDKKGYLYNLSDMDELMHKLLEELLSEDESLFLPDIQTRENLYESYHCFHSFRRASNTRAVEMKVATTDIETVNRWGKEQRAKTGDKVNMPMRQHYAHSELLVELLCAILAQCEAKS